MQRARVSNHPCHRLSVPSAKRFWCRHCMMVFEDAITRWRHSRSCRSGNLDNFVRRREIETHALQKMAETLDPDMMTQMTPPGGAGGASNSKELCCFICKQRFISLDDMREHVKYPCNKPVAVPRPSMTVYIEEPTFGTGIQQHYTEAPKSQGEQCSTSVTMSSSDGTPRPVTVYMNESEQGHPDSEAKPTNIYVNEKGETVIEVENLDLNTKSGELSLAHLLTQLSQQGIVFDQQPQDETEISTSHQETQLVQEQVTEVDYSQPTAVDAANTLTQLAGSMYRASSAAPDTYTYAPPRKRIKTETGEVQYAEGQGHQQAYLQKEEITEGPSGEKYIICTSESEVISVVRAQDMSPEDSNNEVLYHQGDSSHELEAHQIQTHTVMSDGHLHQSSHSLLASRAENGPADGQFEGAPPQVVVLPSGEVQIDGAPGQLIKTEDPSSHIVFAQGDTEEQAQQGIIVSQAEHTEQAVIVSQAEHTEQSVFVSTEEHTEQAVLVSEEEPTEQGTVVSEAEQGTVVSEFPHHEGSVTVVQAEPAISQEQTPVDEGSLEGAAVSSVLEVGQDTDVSTIVQGQEESAADSALVVPQIVTVTSENSQVSLPASHSQDASQQGSSEGYSLVTTVAEDSTTN